MKLGVLILGIASILSFIIPPLGMIESIMCLSLGLIAYLEDHSLHSYVFLGLLLGMLGFTLSAIYFFLEQQAIANAFYLAFDQIHQILNQIRHMVIGWFAP